MSHAGTMKCTLCGGWEHVNHVSEKSVKGEKTFPVCRRCMLPEDCQTIWDDMQDAENQVMVGDYFALERLRRLRQDLEIKTRANRNKVKRMERVK